MKLGVVRAAWRGVGLTQRRCQQKFPVVARWSSTEARQWSTPLAKSINEVINTIGPISLAAYMRQCLTSPDGGYYTSKPEGRDQFGQRGDFITSPEISQMFGELVALWVVAEMMQQKSNDWELIEVGPGRGTLMDDMLRTLHRLESRASDLKAVYLVESSPSLREAQRRLLCGDAPMKETDDGFQSTSKYSNVPVYWREDIRFVPSDTGRAPYIIAHEFFDALPIHAFQSVAPAQAEPSTPSPNSSADDPSPDDDKDDITENLLVGKFAPPKRRAWPGKKEENVDWANVGLETGGKGDPTPPDPEDPPNPSPTSTNPPRASTTPQWRELLVTPAPPPSPSPSSSSSTSEPTPEFQLSLSKASTPNSLVLPEISPRYKALKPQVNTTIEICPEAHSYASEFARRIGGPPTSTSSKPQHKPSGAALIIDYGPTSKPPTSSLRGIRSHTRVSPFTSPGLVDISADVDFVALAEAALKASPGIEVHGPVEQSYFLLAMGIAKRAKLLTRGVGDDEMEKRNRLEDGLLRLVQRGPGGMGSVYKVMAIVPEGGGKRRPVGFGGGVDV